MRRPLVIAGHASGVGKTTVATGLMGALSRRGLKVAPFKVGPDYIDPGYHMRASGAASRNLDTWLTSPEEVRRIYARGSDGADISIIEGVMGLFDGRAGVRQEGSTAETARLTGGAVVLVADCARQARSLAPLLFGFDRFDENIRLAGVILNNIGSGAHARMLRDAAGEAGVAVLGEIPRRAGMSLDSRHLGLVPAAEQPKTDEVLEEIAGHVGQNVDLDALIELGRDSGSGEKNEAARKNAEDTADDLAGEDQNAEAEADDPAGENLSALEADPGRRDETRARISVARDEAFSFYYVDSLEALEAAGAELVWFSPLHDDELPACDGLYLGGGFPEMFAAGLQSNSRMRRSISAAVSAGLPAYAECGGMVYLCRGIEVEGERYEMAGAIGSEARMTGSRQALGYVEARARLSSILMDAGERIRGHEFHWSAVKWQADRLAYDCFSSRRPEVEQDGFCAGNLLASYVHIHFGADNGAAARFVESCATAGGAV